MDFKVEDFKVKPLKNGKYINAYLATYKLNGEYRDWELLKINDSVAILIYNKDNNSFVCVKQFRAALYFNHKITHTLELCAGMIDKDCSIEQIAKEEILEECGFDVPISSIKKLTSFYTSVGSSGSKQYLFFTEVDESMRVNCGGGIDGEEMIEVVEIPINKAREVMFDENIAKTPGLLFAFEWYLNKINVD